MSPARKSSPSAPAPASVVRTPKLWIGGKFVRSESGKTYPLTDRAGTLLANVVSASRKDTREAVRAARGAQAGWAKQTAYNRGQVLFRVAELVQTRALQLVAELTEAGLSAAAARREVDETIDTWVYYAGFADKYAQVIGGANPVAAPYFNFSLPEPTGVVAIIAPDNSSLLGLSRLLAPAIVSGNSAVVLASHAQPLPAVTLSEIMATSDVPAGVVNILTGSRDDVAPTLASHMDINAIDLRGVPTDERTALQLAAVDNLKRLAGVTHDDANMPAASSLDDIVRFTELKTVWHPVGV